MRIASSFVLYFLCLCCCKASGQYTLSVNVKDRERNPIEGAVLILSSTEMSGIADLSGNYSFSGLQSGNYNIVARLNNFNPASVSVKLYRDETVTIILTPLINKLKEVVVKDNHIALQKNEESFNIDIVNSDFIRRYLGGSLMNAVDRLPGIKSIGIGSGQSKPLIRGLGFNRVVVIDKGIKHEGQQWGADHGLEIDQFAAGEVELIKGAASFIYGSDAIGGAVNIKPGLVPAPQTWGGAVDLVAKTNNNLYGTSVNLFGRKQKWFFDSRFTYQDYADYSVPTDRVFVYDYPVDLKDRRLRNTAGNEHGLHLHTGYLDENFRSVFYVSNVSSESGFFANAHGLEPRRVNTGLHDSSNRDKLMPRQDVSHFKIINRSSYRFGIHQLEADLGYQHNFRQEFNPYVNHGYMPPVYPDNMHIPKDLEREFDKHVYTATVRGIFDIGQHNINAGINTEYQDNGISGWSFLVPAFKQFLAGVYAYDKFKISENTLLHGALRYDYGSINMFQYTDWFPTENTYITRAEDLNRTFSSFVWSLGVNYNKEKLVVKANAGKSFRMPIAKELGANGVNYHYFSYEKGNAMLSPEQSYQLDFSLGWNGERWSAQLSPFYNYFPNYIYLNPTPHHDYFYGAGNQIFEYAQSRVMRYGGEIQFKYHITKKLSTELLGEYLYAEQLSGDKKGYTLPFSPPPSALINLTWSPDMGKRFTDNYFSVDYRLVGRQDNIVPPEKKTSGYGLVNLQAGSRISLYQKAVMLSMQVQNLLDKKYLNHTSFYRLIELPEIGRNIVLSLKIPFEIK